MAMNRKKKSRTSATLKQLYLENVKLILERLSRFKTRKAGFSYRKKRHSWLHGGVKPPIESMLLREALTLLNVPYTLEKGSTHSRIIIDDVEALRVAMKNPHLDDVLKEAYKRVSFFKKHS
jgi:hypothetical protein